MLQVLDVKVFDPIGSAAGDVGERGAFVAMGNTAPRAQAAVMRTQQRGVKTDERFQPRTGKGYVAPAAGDYARALDCGVTVVPLLVETFGGLGVELVKALRSAAEWRRNKLVSSEYDETTWSARTFTAFVMQRLSVAIQLSAAQEVAEALGLSVAADPRVAGA